MARRSRGDDARRKATLDIDDDDDDDKDGLVDGLEAILAPPRRASAEECMSRASDWKEWNVTTTRACLSRVHRREEERSTPFFSFFMAKQREASERERERELFPPSHFFPTPFVFPFLHAPARSHGSSSGQQQQGDLPFRLEREHTHRRRIAAAAAAAAAPRSRRHGRR